MIDTRSPTRYAVGKPSASKTGAGSWSAPARSTRAALAVARSIWFRTSVSWIRMLLSRLVSCSSSSLSGGSSLDIRCGFKKFLSFNVKLTRPSLCTVCPEREASLQRIKSLMDGKKRVLQTPLTIGLNERMNAAANL